MKVSAVMNEDGGLVPEVGGLMIGVGGSEITLPFRAGWREKKPLSCVTDVAGGEIRPPGAEVAGRGIAVLGSEDGCRETALVVSVGWREKKLPNCASARRLKERKKRPAVVFIVRGLVIGLRAAPVVRGR